MIDLYILHILIHSEFPVVGTVPVHSPGNSLRLPSFTHHLLGKTPSLLPSGIYHSLTFIPHSASSHHLSLSKISLLGTLPDPATQTGTRIWSVPVGKHSAWLILNTEEMVVKEMHRRCKGNKVYLPNAFLKLPNPIIQVESSGTNSNPQMLSSTLSHLQHEHGKQGGGWGWG